MRKIKSKDHVNEIGSLMRPDGTRTKDEKETLELIMNAHFPGSQTPENHTTDSRRRHIYMTRARRQAWVPSGRIFNKQKMKWAIQSFKPFKSPGKDGIFPALLQKA